MISLGKEVQFIKAKSDFKKLFDKLCLEHNLDTFQAIRILSQTTGEIAHEARNIQLFSTDN